MKLRGLIGVVAMAAALLAVPMTQTGCPEAAQVAPIAVLTVEEAACVVEHWSEPVTQIFADCGFGGSSAPEKQKQVQAVQLAQSVSSQVGRAKAAANCH